MAYAAKIIADSVSPAGVRLTTFEITYPKMVHCELMTHRMFSRNTASSRAIPYSKTREQVMNDPVMPVWWGKNQAGMQAREELTGDSREMAETGWLSARNQAVARADVLQETGLHKQIINRIIEPWMWITAIVTATDYDNFFHLRCHEDAQPEIKRIADMMRDIYYEPASRETDQRRYTQEVFELTGWHLPYIQKGDFGICPSVSLLCQISTARCARVSFLTHDGKRDHAEDLKLFERLRASGHWSPFEHVARSFDEGTYTVAYCGNFRGWIQFRKQFSDEYCRNYKREKVTSTL